MARKWVLSGIEEFSLETYSPGPLPPGWVRVEPAYCGICGSDLHSYKGRHPMVHPPIVLGHEFSGTVTTTGEGVSRDWIGRPVVVEPSLPCGQCYACRHGQYHICRNLRVIGNVGADGAFASTLDVPEDRLVPLPEGFDLALAALVEPTAVAVHALNRLSTRRGSLVVLGAGPIGLLTALTADARGFAPLILADIRPGRLALARELGLEHTVDLGRDALPAYLERLLPDGPDGVIDAVAVESTLNLALEVARKGTAIVLEGVPEEPLRIDAIKIQDRELSLTGTLMYQREDFTDAVALLARGRIPAARLITEVVAFNDLPDAFRRLVHQPQDAMKVLVDLKGAQVDSPTCIPEP